MNDQSNQGARILIVDDMPQNIKLIGTILKNHGFLVSLARSGAQALETIEQNAPDLILLDIMMPGMNGFETCEKLKETPGSEDIPVIFMSALAETVDKVKGFKAGAVDYVTKPIETQELLARINTHLTMRQLRKDLEKAKEAAERANSMKSDFLARMSHEIRTPMNAVIGICHLLSQTELTEMQSDYLTKVQSASEVLLCVINDILDFSRIEAGMLEMESVQFNFHDILETISSLMSVRIGTRDLEFLIDVAHYIPTHLTGDPLRLEQVLINLAGNAIKFTEKGNVVIRVDSDFVEEDRVGLRIAVEDTGVGIPEDQLAGLFSAFSQGGSYITRKYGGSGLGLSICKHLVGMMGGTITVKSEPGKGSVFEFTVTLERHHEDDEVLVHEPELSGKHVLIVDDNPVARDILAGFLTTVECEVTSVQSGEEAIALIQGSNWKDGRGYDIIFMDWKMGGLDGIETTRRIKDLNGLDPAPEIIMLTAFGKEDVKNKAEESGISAFLTKPVTPSVLVKTMMMTLGQSSGVSKKKFITKPEISDGLNAIRGATILIVEDNEVNQMLAGKLLEQVNLKVLMAGNGMHGLEILNEEPVDAVLMDIQMPVMDGYEATRRIRLEDRWKEIPVIAMTAHAMTGEREKCIAAGMDDYVSKPVNPETLYQTLVRWLSDKEI